MRESLQFTQSEMGWFKNQLINWSKNQEPFLLLDSNDYTSKPAQVNYEYDFLAAWGSVNMIKGEEHNGFERLKEFRRNNSDWLFGYFSYDLKNELEDLSSDNTDNLFFPALYFFQPRYVLLSKDKKLELLWHPDFSSKSEAQTILEEIQSTPVPGNEKKQSIPMNSRFSKQEYLETLHHLQRHIKRGDIYEVNFCQEFFAPVSINPQDTYLRLSQISPSPFACFLKFEGNYLISSSPERFLRKRGSNVIAQPIKGTAKRGKDEVEDNRLKRELYHDKKERAENVMIVDLVRNDLSRTALPQSVEVSELFGIYSFEQVHQMISTVSCEIHEDDYLKTLRNCYPMGSMTGAPKVSAMKIIEQYERTKRGLYSGSVGYFTPENDYDFNVVIRSILYNSEKKYVSYSVGGAITYLSDPEKEYEECLLKAQAMNHVLNQ